jgi:putative salt-induced outer membrane protein YdiY
MFFLLLPVFVCAEQAQSEWRPPDDGFDWVQLNNKEWLMGEIKSMYKDNLEFDSDNLDLQSIDWADVTYLRSAGESSINIEDLGEVTGVVEISGNTIRLIDGDDVKEFNRAQLISLTPAGDRELELWAVDLTLNLNLRSGNTEQVDYTTRLSAKRRTARSRVLANYTGNISKTDAGTGTLVETINNQRVSAGWDRYATRSFFWSPFFGEYYRDPFQNIDQRLTAGAGLGYTILDTGKIEWNVSGGPAYQRVRYISVLPGEDDTISGGAVVLATDYDQEINSKLDFIFNYNMTAASSDLGGYTHHLLASLETEITGSLDFDVSFMWDRVGQPTTDADGNTPQPDDYRLMIGIKWSL